MNLSKNKISMSAFALVAAGAISVPVLASAASSSDPTTTETTVLTQQQSEDDNTTTKADRRAEHQARLAEKLGIDVSTLQAAQDEIFEEDLQAAVDEGRITQERADEILEARANGEFVGPGRGHHGPRGFDGDIDTDTLLERLDEAVADGRITQERADEIREAIESGETPFPGRGFRGGFGGFAPSADGDGI